MNKLLNFNNNFKFLCLLFMFVIMARPAYSIPTTIDEIKQVFGVVCADYGLEFCASKPDAGKKTKKPHKFTESEKKILTRLDPTCGTAEQITFESSGVGPERGAAQNTAGRYSTSS